MPIQPRKESLNHQFLSILVSLLKVIAHQFEFRLPFPFWAPCFNVVVFYPPGWVPSIHSSSSFGEPRWISCGLGGAWMSQEDSTDSKWLVNRLPPTYKWGVLGL